MSEKHVGIISGLTDLINFVSAVLKATDIKETDLVVPAQDKAPNIKVILFGAPVSFTNNLIKAVKEIGSKAFPAIELFVFPPDNVSKESVDTGNWFAETFGDSLLHCTLYLSAPHSNRHLDFCQELQPRAVRLFDNGLSTYSEWKQDIGVKFSKRSLPFPEAMFLSLAPPIPIPDHLRAVAAYPLNKADYQFVFRRMRAACNADRETLDASEGWLPSHVIVGTSLFRTGHISWKDERDAYLNLIAHIRSRTGESILFKPHPRSGERPLITENDGVEIFDVPAPLEAFAHPSKKRGKIYSIASSSLIWMKHLYGWTSYRIKTEATQQLFSKQPVLKRSHDFEKLGCLDLNLNGKDTDARSEIPRNSLSGNHRTKIGVLSFGYEGFSNFEHEHRENGVFDVNIGDNMQTLAAEKAVEQLGFPSTRCLRINRDTLTTYDGPQVALIMNGVISPRCFPIPHNIIPIFIGIHVKAFAIRKNKAYFKAHEPIGCRDTMTAKAFQDEGIEAFVTGCLTMVFPHRQTIPDKRKLLIISGSGAGALPSGVLRHIPSEFDGHTELIYQRMPVTHYPLRTEDHRSTDLQARRLLHYYKNNATHVLTPLHHAAVPCLAMGIPTIIARHSLDDRFGYLGNIVPIHIPGTFDKIDWDHGPVDLSPNKARILEMLKTSLKKKGITADLP